MSEKQMTDRDALQYLIEQVQKPEVIPIFEDALGREVLVVKPNGESEIRGYEKEPHDETHEFHTLAGLIDYLKGVQDPERRVLVMVGREKIHVDLDYKGGRADKAFIRLEHSPEFKALLALKNGIGQENLKKMLLTALAGCVGQKDAQGSVAINPLLAILISQIKVEAQDEKEVTIDDLGLAHTQARSSYKITWNDKRGQGVFEQELPYDWSFVLPVYDCFDKPACLDTRLMAKAQGTTLTFYFAIRRLERTLAQTRLELVEALRKDVPANVHVIEGEN